ncbi:hypothetical protein [Rubinisphaera sp.]|uniref:hypothetical protein n=1 Tax=Rubinisphaera sp. TaxID=2024857 RepID=UPI000C102FDF|nr:hypothetical protein [Rubinisphaera sp.]MBV07596.1 hypothetical protein [Rubinisphaera sp.]HCS50281.1 hypothetical protein [Planctomycetaceae bacterium]
MSIEKCCCHKSAESVANYRVRQVINWCLPTAVIALLPKCPLCLAGYFTLLTGAGISLTTAALLRSGVLYFSLAALCFLTFQLVRRKVAIPIRHTEKSL